MKFFKAIALLPVTMLPCVQAQNSTQILQVAMKTLPDCALKCMLSSISNSSCQLTDLLCVARNQGLEQTITECIKSSCTIRQALVAKNFTESTFGGTPRDRSKAVSYSGIIGGGLAVLAVTLRVFARLPCCGGTWGWDDWAIIATMLPVLPLTGLSVVLAHDGLGKDMWRVPPNKITKILHIYYYDESFYLSSLALTKISMLLFYLRIFPEPQFRRWVWVCITLCTLYILSFVPATIFQCIPIHIAWERWDGEHHGKCFNFNAEGWAGSALNIALDLAVIMLPLREMSKLAMSRRKKAGIMFMFLGGGFITVVSILRLNWMIHLANTENVTWDYAPIGYWSTIEVHVGVIIACLPALRSLQHRLFPSNKKAKSYYSKYGGYGYNSKGGSPFPSGRFKNSSTGTSQGSMIKSRDRTKDDKDFIQLDEYEARPGDIESGRTQGHAIHGHNTTEVERGSIRSNSAALPGLSPFPHRDPRDRSPNPINPLSSRIVVRQEYSVNVEDAIDSTMVTPPRRVSEEERAPVIQKKESQNWPGFTR